MPRAAANATVRPPVATGIPVKAPLLGCGRERGVGALQQTRRHRGLPFGFEGESSARKMANRCGLEPSEAECRQIPTRKLPRNRSVGEGHLADCFATIIDRCWLRGIRKRIAVRRPPPQRIGISTRGDERLERPPREKILVDPHIANKPSHMARRGVWGAVVTDPVIARGQFASDWHFYGLWHLIAPLIRSAEVRRSSFPWEKSSLTFFHSVDPGNAECFLAGQSHLLKAFQVLQLSRHKASEWECRSLLSPHRGGRLVIASKSPAIFHTLTRRSVIC